MLELSLATIKIIALTKVLLLITFICALLLLWYKRDKPWLFSLLLSLTVTGFYLILVRPLQTMWWGNNGDEMFLVAFLSQTLLNNPLADFYYHGLPPFYPPLYFWLTGIVSRPFASNAIGAAKIGISAVLLLWFIGTYAWLNIFKKLKIVALPKSFIQPWFWVILPLIFFFVIDFDGIILKPYETLPALAVAIFVGLFSEALINKKWTLKQYLFFGISGGILFLTYYFWWFIAVPALVVLILTNTNKVSNFIKLLITGIIIFIISAIYLIPLLISYQAGIENWQAFFFIPNDFSTFLPFVAFSWHLPLIASGIIGLIAFHKQPFVRANIILLLMGFAYQYANIFMFLAGKNSLQAAKPFMALGTASIAVGCVYLLTWLWQKYVNHLDNKKQKLIILGLLIFSLPFWPMVTFIDDPVVRNQIEKDQKKPGAFYLADEIKKNVPDYLDKTWLSSGIPELNAYIPIHYFIAHNPHFSHQASKYSERMIVIKKLTQSSTDDFINIIEQTPIDALLLYNNPTSDNYPLFFWQDNYPNGGKELQIDISKKNIDALNWHPVYGDREWIIYLK